MKILGIPTKTVRALQRGGRDSNNQVPEIKVSDGKGNPCRHCLELMEEGEEMLVFSHKPFQTTQPYAEQGPVFVHKRECTAYQVEDGFPEVLENSAEFIVRGYDDAEQIVYGTGKIVPFGEIEAYSKNLLAKGEIKFVHIRSSTNNCYQARIERT